MNTVSASSLIPPLFQTNAKTTASQRAHAVLRCDVLVRGNGSVGCTLALLLARLGLKVGLVGSAASVAHRSSKVSATQADVRAYLLNAASQQVLAGIAQWTSALSCNALSAMRVQADGQVHNIVAPQGEVLGWIVDAFLLEQQLRAACAAESRITLLSDQDVMPQAALQVICEGKHSRSRAAVGSTVERIYYPQTALVARLHCGWDHGLVARQWFAGDNIIALLPMLSAAGAPQELALVWSQPHAAAQQRQQCDATEFIAELERISNHALGPLQLLGERQTWPLTLAHSKPWVGSGFALAGDAAHGIHPLAGQGLNLGLADAACLAQVLEARESWRSLGDARLLRRYARARAHATQSMAQRCDALQILFMQQHPLIQTARKQAQQAFVQAQRACAAFKGEPAPTTPAAVLRFIRGL